MARKPDLDKGRWYKNGGPFSRGHLKHLPRDRFMFDVDGMKIRVDVSMTKEESVFLEYKYKGDCIEFKAIFSLKHKQAKLKAMSGGAWFAEKIISKCEREIARQLHARLFLVFTEDEGRPPFEIHEIDIENASSIHRATVNGQTDDAWHTAWRELGLL